MRWGCSMPSRANRYNRATRVAYLPDLARIFYAIQITAFCHHWAMVIIGKLIPSAETVLQFLAALHRTGRSGYLGTYVAYQLLAPEIARATRRKCSERTLKRGIAALKMLGLVTTSPRALPGFRTKSGAKVNDGSGVVDLGGRYRSKQINFLILTDRAVSMWDLGTADNEVIPHFPTQAKVAPSSQNDQCVNTHMIRDTASESVTTTDRCNRRFDHEPKKLQKSIQPSSPDLEGQSTRPAAETGPPTVEHLSSTNPPRKIKPTTKRPAEKAAKTASGLGRGCTVPRPEKPRNPARTTWDTAARYILNELHKTLENFGSREADAIFARAKIELSPDLPAKMPASVDWPYWIARFPDMTIPARRYAMLREILPVLQSRSIPAPFFEPKLPLIDRAGGDRKRPTTVAAEKSTKLDPFLSRMARKLGLK